MFGVYVTKRSFGIAQKSERHRRKDVLLYFKPQDILAQFQPKEILSEIDHQQFLKALPLEGIEAYVKQEKMKKKSDK
jgi:hypothetical protein